MALRIEGEIVCIAECDAPEGCEVCIQKVYQYETWHDPGNPGIFRLDRALKQAGWRVGDADGKGERLGYFCSQHAAEARRWHAWPGKKMGELPPPEMPVRRGGEDA